MVVVKGIVSVVLGPLGQNFAMWVRYRALLRTLLRSIQKNACPYNENCSRGMYLNVRVYEEFAELAERAKTEFVEFAA